MKISRRRLLTSLGGAAAGLAGWNLFGQSPAQTQALLEEWSNYEEQFRVSICQQCPGGCGILVRVVDGNVVRIAGNPLYPVNKGGLCMKGLAGAQVLYDPDRLRSPLVRDGDRGSGRFKPIAWDDAIGQVVDRLAELREAGEAHTAAVLGGQYRGQTDALLRRFCTVYGTPNYLRSRCMAPEQAAPSHRFLHGLDEPLSYDLANSRLILSFGCNLLESWQATVHQQWAYGRQRQGDGGERGRLIQVDTRLSVTAAKADQWIPVNPGTDAALALGLAHIIIQEGLYDRAFVQEHTFGFEDWKDDTGHMHSGFRSLVLNEHPPQRIASITGVSVATLFDVARAFALNRPAIAIGEKGPPYHAGDLYTRMAIHSLNALVGSIGVEGGVVRQGHVPLAKWEEPELDGQAEAGLAEPRLDDPTGALLFRESDVQQLPANMAAAKPYGLKALFLYYSNPLYSLPDRQRWLAALDKVPFVVSFSPFLDETSLHADLILPDHTYLERWQDDQVAHLAGMTVFGIGRPVVPPLHDTRQTADVIIQIAQALGGPVEAAFPWGNYEELLYESAIGLHESGRGHVVTPPQDEAFEAILARQGYRQEPFDSFDDFWDALLQRGAWWDPNDSYLGMRQLFRTPTRKFEFFSQRLRDELRDTARRLAAGESLSEDAALDRLARSWRLQARGDLLFLPHYEATGPRDGHDVFPYILNTYKLISHAGGRGANQPWLQQQPAVHIDAGWESWVEVNPQTAVTHGIADGDWVWLESARDRFKVRARLYPGAMPQVLNMPFGQGHWAYGHWAKGRGENPNGILTLEGDPMSGVPLWGSTRVRLIKA